jgi:hypothetical protein
MLIFFLPEIVGAKTSIIMDFSRIVLEKGVTMGALVHMNKLLYHLLRRLHQPNTNISVAN